MNYGNLQGLLFFPASLQLSNQTRISGIVASFPNGDVSIYNSASDVKLVAVRHISFVSSNEPQFEPEDLLPPVRDLIGKYSACTPYFTRELVSVTRPVGDVVTSLDPDLCGMQLENEIEHLSEAFESALKPMLVETDPFIRGLFPRLSAGLSIEQYTSNIVVWAVRVPASFDYLVKLLRDVAPAE
jgi:hypothetical protein